MSVMATRPGACVVCAEKVTVENLKPGDVTCSQHFIESLFGPEDPTYDQRDLPDSAP